MMLGTVQWKSRMGSNGMHQGHGIKFPAVQAVLFYNLHSIFAVTPVADQMAFDAPGIG